MTLFFIYNFDKIFLNVSLTPHPQGGDRCKCASTFSKQSGHCWFTLGVKMQDIS